MNRTTHFILSFLLTLTIAPLTEGKKSGASWLDGLNEYLPWLETAAKKPHILYVVMDDQGYGDVGFTYPDLADVITPVLDGLANKGEPTLLCKCGTGITNMRHWRHRVDKLRMCFVRCVINLNITGC